MYDHNILYSRGEKGKQIFPCSRSRLRFWSHELGSTVPSRVSLPILHTQAESGAYLPGFLPSSATASVYLFKPPYANGSVPSSSGHANAYRWRSLPRVRRHKASSPQVPVTGAAFASYHGPINERLNFPTLYYYWYKVGMLKV